MDPMHASPYKKQLKTQCSLPMQTSPYQLQLRHYSARFESYQALASQFIKSDVKTHLLDEDQTTQASHGLIFRRQETLTLDGDMDHAYMTQPKKYGNSSMGMYFGMLGSQQIVPSISEDLFIETKPRSSTMRTDETKFKTELCKNWEETGRCNYGIKCQFAHGREELNINPTVITNNKYKSKSCIQYHSQDFCSYGSRCMFIHEMRTVEEIQDSYYFQILMQSLEFYQNEVQSWLGRKAKRLEFFQMLTNKTDKVWKSQISLFIASEENKSEDEC